VAGEDDVNDRIRATTSALLSNPEARIARTHNRRVFDVSFVAGHSGLFEKEASSVDDLSRIASQYLDPLRCFDVLRVNSPNSLHITLFSLYRDKEPAFENEYGFQSRRRDYLRASEIVQAALPLRVIFDSICLSPTGAVLLQGASAGVVALRTRLERAFPDQCRSRPTSVHMTLARLRQSVTGKELGRLYQWALENRRFAPHDVNVTAPPRLVATRDRNGSRIHREEMKRTQQLASAPCKARRCDQRNTEG
jgi:hypothetical protein